jgi:hypothetical protein
LLPVKLMSVLSDPRTMVVVEVRPSVLS